VILVNKAPFCATRCLKTASFKIGLDDSQLVSAQFVLAFNREFMESTKTSNPGQLAHVSHLMTPVETKAISPVFPGQPSGQADL
jgi:hypothetical protein